jgi:hypothetical protein
VAGGPVDRAEIRKWATEDHQRLAEDGLLADD